jgi:hypothetical protein
MQKSVLAEIVRALTKKEIRELNKWLQSPVHNQREDVQKLFDYLVRKVAKLDANFEKEDAWKAIFPRKAYDDAFMRQVMFFLQKNIEEYLTFSEINKDPVFMQATLLRIYLNRQLDRPFRLTLETTKREQLRIQNHNSDSLRTSFVINQYKYHYSMSRKWSGEVNLQETADALDISYIGDKLRIYCHMISHQYIYSNVSYRFEMLEPILEYVERNQLLHEPVIAMYYYAYKTLVHREEEHYFEELIQLIFSKGQLFPISELRELYLTALNYCINRINAGKEPYLRKAYELYKSGFEQGILLENAPISQRTFGNAVSSALKIREFNWAEWFIESFKDKLEEKSRDSIVNYNLARLYFEKGDYAKAQQLLMKFEFDDMVLNLVAKTMLLKIYYEEDEYSAFESLLESMRIYLQRKEGITSNYRIAYKNLFSTMRKLIHLNPYSKPQREKFRETILQTNPLIEREWLLKQIDGK